MIIDFHTHCFSDKIAAAAMANLSKNSQYPPHADGTLAGLQQRMREAGIDYSVVLNIATNERQNLKVNDWAIELLSAEGIIPFGSIHPDFADYRNEIDRLVTAGIRGLKFHPDYQNFFANDRRVYPIYEYALSRGLVMIFHCGCDLVLREPYHCTPEMLSDVIRDFPGSRIVGAHLGGQNMWQRVFDNLLGKDLYLDTSFGFKFMTAEQIQHTLNNHSGDKLLFATDAPWQKQSVEVAEMQAISMNGRLRDKIFYHNAARLLSIK